MTRTATLFVAILLASCATPLPPVPADYTLTGSEGLVVGRVDGFKPGWKFFDTALTAIKVRNAADGARAEIRAEQKGGDSYFSAVLPAGRYAIWEVQQGNLVSSPPVQFDVKGGAITYVGTLQFNQSGLGSSVAASMLNSNPTMTGRWAVVDDYAGALAHFRETHPNAQEMTKSLMVLGN